MKKYKARHQNEGQFKPYDPLSFSGTAHIDRVMGQKPNLQSLHECEVSLSTIPHCDGRKEPKWFLLLEYVWE